MSYLEGKLFQDGKGGISWLVSTVTQQNAGQDSESLERFQALLLDTKAECSYCIKVEDQKFDR